MTLEQNDLARRFIQETERDLEEALRRYAAACDSLHSQRHQAIDLYEYWQQILDNLDEAVERELGKPKSMAHRVRDNVNAKRI